ncbi:MAG: ThuA domain-containing protein [Flavobacteriaceae bacterium]|nr:ThuA domain-containing protein [Flavobacteriaceae bacterium]
MMKRILFMCALSMVMLAQAQNEAMKMLVYSNAQNTATWSQAKKSMENLAATQSLKVVFSSDQAVFKPNMADAYVLVVLLQTDRDLQEASISHLEAFTNAGGGLMVVHSKMNQANFFGAATNGMQPLSQLSVSKAADSRVATYFMKANWSVLDMPYRATSLQSNVDLLLGTKNSPISWSKSVGKGKLFATVLGGDAGIYQNKSFQKHLEGAIVFCLNDM